MHSFHHSRGRIVFEVLCALGMAASGVAAWRQTGASALLAAAAIAALYGFAHLFDLRRPKPAGAVKPQRIEFDTETERQLPADQYEFATPSAEDQPPAADTSIDQTETVEPVALRSVGGRRSGGSRKGSGRRTGARKEVKAARPAAPAEIEAVSPTPPEETSVVELAARTEEEFALMPEEEAAPLHIQPLFEPEPFARMPRPAFGRRGRI